MLTPAILKQGQDAVIGTHGDSARFWLVFHGGSGSELADIHETLDYGVIKMNVDTDTQYAFTRPIIDHMLKHYDEVFPGARRGSSRSARWRERGNSGPRPTRPPSC